eukprot:1901829-Amphidinium_carterae.2
MKVDMQIAEPSTHIARPAGRHPRSRLLAKHIHLLRVVPTPLLLGRAKQIDGQVLDTLSNILDLSSLGPNQVEALQILVSCGGLGFHSLAWEACKHHVTCESCAVSEGQVWPSCCRQCPFPEAVSADPQSDSQRAAGVADATNQLHYTAGAVGRHGASAASEEAWAWGCQQACLLLEELAGSSVSAGRM